jgi:hypothetical protein
MILLSLSFWGIPEGPYASRWMSASLSWLVLVEGIPVEVGLFGL